MPRPKAICKSAEAPIKNTAAAPLRLANFAL